MFSRPSAPLTPRRGLFLLLLLFLASGLGGCVVWKSDYDTLKAQCLKTNGEMQQTLDSQTLALAERDAVLKKQGGDLTTLRSERDGERRQRESLQEALTRSQTYAETLEARLDELEGRIATLARDRSKLAGSVEEMQTALRELQRRKALAESRVNEYRDLLRRFQSLIDAGKLKIKIVDGRMVVELATDVLFPSGKAELSEEGARAIGEVTAVLVELPNKKYQVEGHTDNIPISKSFPSNWELASARALTVLKFMVSKGMPSPRISASSYAETRPVQSNKTPQGRAANRRIEIVVVPNLSTLPGFDELEDLSSQPQGKD